MSRTSADEYLTQCGWQRVDQSMGPSGWEHPSKPGEVLSEVDALFAQGGMAKPSGSRGTSRYRGGARPAPDQWEGMFDDR